MTKRQLIEEVAQRYPRFSRRDAEVMVNAVFDSMTDALAKGERIEIRGFGSFIVKQRAAREGRNPRTGTLVSVSAKKVPLFKVGKELRREHGLSQEALKFARPCDDKPILVREFFNAQNSNNIL